MGNQDRQDGREDWLDPHQHVRLSIGRSWRRPEVLRGALAVALLSAAIAIALPHYFGHQDSHGLPSSQSPTSPVFGFEPAFAYDSDRRQGVLFANSGDTWIWSKNHWLLAHPKVSPQPRYSAAAAWHPKMHQILLFGGYAKGSAGPLRDTWAWTGSTWMMVGDSRTAPTGGSVRMAYDRERQEMVLILAGSPVAPLTETWSWDGSRWQQKLASVLPYRSPFTAAYDAVTRSILMVAHTQDGRRSETWSWDGGSWQRLAPAHKPSASAHMLLMLEPISGKLFLLQEVGDRTGGPIDIETWSWDGHDWLQVVKGSEPSNLAGAASVMDGAHLMLAVFGTVSDGASRTPLAAVWTWAAGTWVRMQPNR